MGKLNWKLFKTNDMFCIEKAMSTCAFNWGRSFEMIFLEMWDFDFLPENQDSNKLIGGRIIYNRNNNIADLFKKYHGIHTSNFQTSDITIFSKTLKKQLSNEKPILLTCDQSFLPWINENKKYGIERYSGALFLYDYNKSLDTFTCMDLHNDLESLSLPFSDLLNSVRYKELYDFVSFTLIGEFKEYFELSIIINSLIKSISSKKATCLNSFEAMNNFTDSIFDINLSLEVPDQNSWYWTPLCFSLRNVTRSRNLLALTFNYLYDKLAITDFNEVSRYFLQSGSEWNSMLSLISKAVYTSRWNNDIKGKVVSMVLDAKKIEEKIYNIVSNINPLYPNSLCRPTMIPNTQKDITKEFNYLDIQTHCNNKAIITDITDINSIDLDELKSGFLLNKIPDKYKICGDGFSFKLALGDNLRYDNISCQGQEINILSIIANEIFFLCCSEWGDYFDKVVIEYSDGKVEELFLQFYDWSCNSPSSGWSIAIEGEAIDTRNINSRGFPVYLFYKKFILINNKSTVKRVILPHCINAHIFSITLI